MNTLYWLTVLGHVNFVAIFASVALLFSFIALTIPVVFDEELDCYRTLKRVWKLSFIGFIISLAISVMIPSRDEIYAIYGVGSVLDYAKNSEEVQKLPDNAVKALNIYLEDIQKTDSTNQTK